MAEEDARGKSEVCADEIQITIYEHFCVAEYSVKQIYLGLFFYYYFFAANG